MRVGHSHDPVNLNRQNIRGNVCFGIKSRKGIRKRYIFASTPHVPPCSRIQHCYHRYQVEEAQKKAIVEYRKEHPEMGEDALLVELPKATGEASGSRDPRPPARPVPLYNRIEPLRPAQDLGHDRHHRLLEAIRQDRMRNPGPAIEAALRFGFGNAFQRAQPAPEIPEDHLPQPRPNVPDLPPIGAGENPQIQEAPQQRGDVWVQRRRSAQQQRVLAGRFARHNTRMDPMDRGRVDQWRRGIPDQGGLEDGAVL